MPSARSSSAFNLASTRLSLFTLRASFIASISSLLNLYLQAIFITQYSIAYQRLLECLDDYTMEHRRKMMIFLRLRTEEQKLDMLTYMAQNRNATGDDLMAQAEKIAGELP